jgi:hypothetical protein
MNRSTWVQGEIKCFKPQGKGPSSGENLVLFLLTPIFSPELNQLIPLIFGTRSLLDRIIQAPFVFA